MKQRTLKNNIVLKGVGLHTGKPITMELCPAPPNSGVLFMRTDLEGSPLVKASVETVFPPDKFPRRTSVGKGEVVIHTVEHFLAVLSGMGIDNILVKLDAEELPGLDGSGKEFLEAIKKAGITEQDVERMPFMVRSPVYVKNNDSLIACFPYKGLKIGYLLDYNHPLLKDQFVEREITFQVFEEEIASARTFCLEEEVEPLRKMGLGKGADYSNTLVVSSEGVINNQPYFEDEFARHKLLDLLGDLYLLGPMEGYILAIRGGHRINIEFVKKLKQHRDQNMKSGVLAKFPIEEETSLNIDQIMQILPHRYPFLFVDRILKLEPGKKAVGIKNVTVNDYFFEGHFPNKPVMPGVLIIEAMAQTGGVLMLSLKENVGKLAYFIAADKVKFRKTVEPGDTLIMEAEARKIKSKTGIVCTRCFVDSRLVAEAELYFALSES